MRRHSIAIARQRRSVACRMLGLISSASLVWSMCLSGAAGEPPHSSETATTENASRAVVEEFNKKVKLLGPYHCESVSTSVIQTDLAFFGIGKPGEVHTQTVTLRTKEWQKGSFKRVELTLTGIRVS